jgi:hypothetical protein
MQCVGTAQSYVMLKQVLRIVTGLVSRIPDLNSACGERSPAQAGRWTANWIMCHRHRHSFLLVTCSVCSPTCVLYTEYRNTVCSRPCWLPSNTRRPLIGMNSRYNSSRSFFSALISCLVPGSLDPYSLSYCYWCCRLWRDNKQMKSLTNNCRSDWCEV